MPDITVRVRAYDFEPPQGDELMRRLEDLFSKNDGIEVVFNEDVCHSIIEVANKVDQLRRGEGGRYE